MPTLRTILTRLFGRPTGAVVTPTDIDATTLGALAEGRLAPPFAHDAPAGSTCAIGWHCRRVTIAEAFDGMRGGSSLRRRSWFRLPKRAGLVTEQTVGELFAFGQLLPDGMPARDAFLCDACGRAVSATA